MIYKELKMPEILLNFGEGDLVRANRAGVVIGNLWGVKIGHNKRYIGTLTEDDTDEDGPFDYDHNGAMVHLRKRGAKRIIQDTKIADDNKEVIGSVKTILKEDAAISKVGLGTYLERLKPDYITAYYPNPPTSIVDFVDTTRNYGVGAIVSFPTSRYTVEEFESMGIDLDKAVPYAAQLCSELGATLMIGAVDAEIARDVDPKLPIIGYGSCLDKEELSISTHARPVLISQCAPYLNVLAFGSTIFNDPFASDALRKRQEAAYEAVS